MAAIAVQDVPQGGLASVTFAACTGGGDTVAGQSKRTGGYALHETLLIFRNTNAAVRNITVGSLAAVQIPVTTGVSIIPVPDEGINDASVAITYDAVTNLDVACVRIGATY
jgi:hypothetical protein